jgi:Tol biopolymer transport system component
VNGGNGGVGLFEAAQREGHTSGYASNDGTDPHKLVTVPGIPGWVESYILGWPRWSPDASRSRFSVLDPRTLSYALWEISTDGSNLHPLLPGWNNPPAECCGVWSPDGKYFIFQSTRNGRTDLWAIRGKVNPFQQAGRRPVQLTAGPMSSLGPNSSRDGTKLTAASAYSSVSLLSKLPCRDGRGTGGKLCSWGDYRPSSG